MAAPLRGACGPRGGVAVRARRVKAPKGPRSLCARCKGDCTDAEHALTREQGAALGLDADTALVCLGCLRQVRP